MNLENIFERIKRERTMKNKELVDEFARLCKHYCRQREISAQMPAPYALQLTPKGIQTQVPYLTISAGVHGNEQESVQALNNVLEEAENELQQAQKPVLFVLGNPRAVEENVRYIDTDLNRQFFAEKERVQKEFYEGNRALELLSCAKGTRYLLDIHSTDWITKKPYGIFPNRPDLIQFLQDLGTDITDIILMDVLSPDEGMCFDEHFYVTDANCTPITIEVGHIGNGNVAVERAKKAIYGALHRAGILSGEEGRGPKPRLWTEVQKIRNEPDVTLVGHLENFEETKKGDILAYHGNTPVRSIADGVIFFPNYTQQKAPYLVRVAVTKD